MHRIRIGASEKAIKLCRLTGIAALEDVLPERGGGRLIE